MAVAMATRVFISFDFDHDEDLKNLLVGQARNDDSPFEIGDWSIKESLEGDWQSKVRERIKQVGQVVVICGHHTDSATGVSAELLIARDEERPYFLLAGRATGTNVKPQAALEADKVYRWTWENLTLLIGGAR
jgi:hypothetical protein